LKIEFFHPSEVDESTFFAAAIITQYKEQWVMCKHRERDTWEAPGGRREKNEMILETAKRELYEETGATNFSITPICGFSTNRNAMLYYATVETFGELPNSEIKKIDFFKELPKNLTYPELHIKLYKKVKSVIDDI